MSILSVVYIVIVIAAFAASLWVRHLIKVPAATKWFWRLFYLAAAIMVAVVITIGTRDLNAMISGYFIAAMFVVFAFWQSGLSETSVINKLSSVRQFQTLSAIQLVPLASGCQLQAMVGSIVVIRLRFMQSPTDVAQFLQARMEPKRVVIVQ
ncbi:hypothetical protein [Lacticaseibacillus jixiensis]|uniref:hypothetical protein n=1 Tax=Lacticaseibacillus jixiensis TaxID=3231926 RepID=UPI0036F1E552